MKPILSKTSSLLADKFWGNKPYMAKNTIISNKDGITSMQLYSTVIAQIIGNELILRNGGYKTQTTKARLNAVLAPLNMWITQKKMEWYICTPSGIVDIFKDGIKINLGEIKW